MIHAFSESNGRVSGGKFKFGMAENMLDLQTMAAFLSAPLLYAGATLIRNAFVRQPFARIANVANQPDQESVSGVHVSIAESSKASDQKVKTEDANLTSRSIEKIIKSEEQTAAFRGKSKRQLEDGLDTSTPKVQRSRSSSSKKESVSAPVIVPDIKSPTSGEAIPDSALKARSKTAVSTIAVAPVVCAPKSRARKTDVQETDLKPTLPSQFVPEDQARASRTRKSSPAAASETSSVVLQTSDTEIVKSENSTTASSKVELSEEQLCPFLHRSIHGLSIARHRAMLR